MADMSVSLCGKELKNPVIAASGTFGFAREFVGWLDISRLGGFSLKALTREPREGNPPPRIAETSSGVLNSVGLQNPGVDEYLRRGAEGLADFDTVRIANVAGATYEDYVYVIERLNGVDTIDLFELNISCPNVKHGGAQHGGTPEGVLAITKLAKAAAKKPLIVKLSPNVASIKDVALAAQEGGADAISLINTLTGMAIDLKTRRPLLANVTGGLSGPAIKPVALRMVYEAASVVSIPIIGMGGIMTGRDAAEFMVAGATAVMVGTANLTDPSACLNIIEGLEEYLDANGILAARELTGTLRV